MRRSASLLIPLTLIAMYYAALVGVAWFFSARYPEVTGYLPFGGLDDLPSGSAGNAFEPVYTSVERNLLSSEAPIRLLGAIVGAVLLAVPVSWAYFITSRTRRISQSFVQTILIMPILVTGIAFIVLNSIALAFSLAGIVAAVRFRFSLSQPSDAMYIFVAIGIGLGAGISALGIAYAISLTFVVATLIIWKLEYGKTLSGPFLTMMTRRDGARTITRSILIVHGRDFKPSAESYLDISMAAMRSGIERDYPECLDAFDAMRKELAWYGDLNAEALEEKGGSYDEELDLGDRRNALAALREVTARKRFGIQYYDKLPGKSAIPEFIAGCIAPAASSLGLSRLLVRAVSKDAARYFDRKLDFAVQARERVREKLCELMGRGDRIALVAHGTGSVVAYDVLWQLSHDPALCERYGDAKVELFVTLGSPLGDTGIRKCLLGANEKPAAKFPENVISWHNVAAEDDYTCHDNTLADDFKKMLQHRLVSAVHDYKVFNLAVRYGRSNPHSSIGYYIHPRVSKIVSDWLT